MGAVHVDVTIRNPAEPQRKLDQQIPRRYRRVRLARAEVSPQGDRAQTEGSPRVRACGWKTRLLGHNHRRNRV